MKSSTATTCELTCLRDGRQRPKGFSLLELLVVLAVIGMLMTISLSVMTKVRRHMNSVLGANNQKQIVAGATLYAFDNHGRYPESVATVGFGSMWNWSEPTKLVGNEKRSPGMHRSVSEYLREYIADADVMFCRNAPQKYKYLHEAWAAGDAWDNPETPFPTDPVGGTYCLYWNYIGFLEERDYPFRGPHTIADGRKYSDLLVSDYFGYDHWRSPEAFGSCEQFKSARIVPETWLLSAYWSTDSQNKVSLGIPLRAGYTDGHVGSFDAAETVTMRVSITSDGTVPYPVGVGPGFFFLPQDCLR